MVAITTQRRLATLEAASDDGGDGCPRCRGVMVALGSAETGEALSARWNGEAITAEQLQERETEVRCPACGRDMSADNSPVIAIGGPAASRRHPDA